MARRCKNNKLLCRWDKTENDLKFWFPRKCDGSLLNHHLCGKRVEPLMMNDYKWIHSFTDELEKRGYDITTLRFEIDLMEKKIN